MGECESTVLNSSSHSGCLRVCARSASTVNFLPYCSKLKTLLRNCWYNAAHLRMEEPMKRLLATVMLMCCLSFPAYAGHVIPDGAYCACGTFNCACDPGEKPLSSSKGLPPGKAGETSPVQTGDGNLGSEALLLALLLAVWLR